MMEVKNAVIRINETREDAKKGLNGNGMVLEVDGKPLAGQMSMVIDAKPNKVATCTVTFLMPDIRYKGE